MQGISDETIAVLAQQYFKLEEIASSGEAIFEEGDSADKLYLLLEGSVVIWSGETQVT